MHVYIKYKSKKFWFKIFHIDEDHYQMTNKTDMLCVSIIRVAKQSNTRYTKATGLQINIHRSSLCLDAVAHF